MSKSRGMRSGRSRNSGNGRLRGKRSDTHVSTIERIYGRNFHVRSDMRLGTLLKQRRVASLNDLITGR